MIAPTRFEAKLQSRPSPEDPNSTDPGQLPTYNAYSPDGDVTAPLVYVNYGVPEDYDYLKQQRHRREGQDRDRPLRIELARREAEGRLRAWRGRLPDLFRSEGRRLFSRRRLSAGTVPSDGRRAARQRHGYGRLSRRSAVAGMGVGERARGGWL